MTELLNESFSKDKHFQSEGTDRQTNTLLDLDFPC